MQSCEWWLCQAAALAIGVAEVVVLTDYVGLGVATGMGLMLWGNNLMMATKK